MDTNTLTTIESSQNFDEYIQKYEEASKKAHEYCIYRKSFMYDFSWSVMKLNAFLWKIIWILLLINGGIVIIRE